jgi:arylsulfatase A-like enzyme
VGPDVTTSGDVGTTKISDIAPTILQLMDCAVPTDMDGNPLDVADGEVQHRDPIPSPHDDGQAGQNQEVRNRLEELGYLS